MTSTAATATPTRLSFERRLEEVKLSKSDINSIIMDYLISEGYPSAARKFAIEADIVPMEDVASIQERVEIRNAIHRGEIERAIEKISELGYQILDGNPSLHFALLRLQLVELIRASLSNGDIAPALEFATTHLAPRAPTNPEFLEDLEHTMALLIFPPDDLAPPLAALLDPTLRKSVANRVNEAILIDQGARREARIRRVIRLRAWAEQKAREVKKDLPERLYLGLRSDEGNTNGTHDVEMQETDDYEDRESL
ncbi:MAG: hypothetical protein M1826_001599 [Phylliscum demangeonii]|nr:MAG: hypothetical protein M1826_001599 [Phylliscum demangeonii]